MRLLPIVPLLVFVVGCATTTANAPRPKAEVLHFDPVEVTPSSKEELELANLNDEELFALGTSAYAAGDMEKAARCFSRLADVYPESPHRRNALYNAGLSYEKLGRFEEALDRFVPLADAEKGTGDALHAAFRVAECYYHLDNYTPAIELLAKIAVRDDIPFQEKLQAKVQGAICMIENQQLDQAEKELRVALLWYEQKKESELLDDYFPSQAQFFLGEIYRIYFEHVALDPDKGEDKLARDLEYKCELLLSAQGHFLRAIRLGNGQWATAAGFRIGALYENLYDAMLDAKVPAEFDDEQKQIYREELRKKVRILITKAMGIYERTLAAAERIGVDNPFIQKTRQSLERMKQILLEESERESPTPASAKESGPATGSRTARTATDQSPA